MYWNYAIEKRSRGWLDESFQAKYREILLHACARYGLVCPAYTLMPDHMHHVLMGAATNRDQLSASVFVRKFAGVELGAVEFQHQPHDHVLREHERERGAYAATCHYILENPVRERLVSNAADWKYSGAVVPGYPNLDVFGYEYWPKFWRI